MEKEDFFLSIYDICGYVHPARRPLVEGERLLRSNHIMVCGKLEENSDKNDNKKEVNIRALCLRTTRMNEEPYEIEIKISENTIYDHDRLSKGLKIEGICKCVAGLSGKCKHFVGTLLYVNRITIKNLDVLSCTDIAQSWGKLKTQFEEMYKAKPVKEFCHFKETKGSLAMKKFFKRTHLTDEEIRSKFIKLLPNSEIALHAAGRHKVVSTERVDDDVDRGPYDAPSDSHCRIEEELANFIKERLDLDLVSSNLNETSFPNGSKEDSFYQKNVLISKEEAMNLCFGTTNQSENEDWKKHRSSRITGSICYNVFTYAKNKNPNWLKKVKDLFSSSFMGNDKTNHGKLEEPNARKHLEENYGLSVKQLGLFVHPNAPWLGASPDGLANYDHLVEIKCPTYKLPLADVIKSGKLKYLNTVVDENGNVKVSLKGRHPYYGQITLGMGLLNLKSCYFLIYNSFDKQDLLLEIPFNESFFIELTKTCKTAYFDHILPILSAKTS